MHFAYAADVPPVTDTELEQALTLAGSNRGELEQALQAGLQKPYTMQALRFLVVNSPAADLGKLTAAELVEHVELAMQARGDNVFGAHYDDATWAHYVLPPRVSQEPLSAWRPYFYAELREVVAGALTLEQAAVAVNQWCGERVVFKQTQSRDQGPLATLAGGYGRCEELCILLIDACRAVGIPARMAYCPWWAVQDNNHAWVEIYGSDGRWHYTGGAEPRPTLDDAWFGEAVKAAPIIVSPSFGLPGLDEDLSGVLDVKHDVGARFCRINSTRFYRQTGWLDVELPQQSEQPAEQASATAFVTVHVFNYGALRPVAKLEVMSGLNSLGAIAQLARVQLGAGDYVLTCDFGSAAREVRATVRTGETTRIVWPDYLGEPPQPESYILQYPADG